MRIAVNGEIADVKSQTLADVLVELGHSGAKIATAVNEEFVPASKRADVVLEAGDRVEIVAPRQGG